MSDSKIKILKKISSLALLAFASSSFAAETNDECLTLKLEGLFNFQSGFRAQKGLEKDEKNISRHNKNVGFYTDSAISALVSKSLDEVTYGGKIVLIPTSTLNTQTSYNGSHIFIETSYGKVELGSPYDAGAKMRLTGYEVVAATGDDFGRYAKLDGSKVSYDAMAPEFGFYSFFLDDKHKMELKAANDKSEPSRKISYFTPEVNGFQAGVSYIPDTSNSGVGGHNKVAGGKSVVKMSDGTSMRFDKNVKNAFSGGVSYTHQIADGISVKTALTGEYGKSVGYLKHYENYDDTKNKLLKSQYKLSDMRTYNIGVVLNYGSMAYGVSYGNLGKSLTTSEYHKVGRNTSYYNAGVGYTQGAFKTSVSYFQSNQYKAKLDAIVVGTEYKLAPGLLPYAEVTYFKAKGKPVYYPEAPNKNTKGTVAILGAKLKF